MVVARVGHRDALNDQAPVAHDHAAVLVVAQRNSLGLIVIRHAVLILRFNCPHAHFAALVERPTGPQRTAMFMHNAKSNDTQKYSIRQPSVFFVLWT